jgi:hypothetical protein
MTSRSRTTTTIKLTNVMRMRRSHLRFLAGAFEVGAGEAGGDAVSVVSVFDGISLADITTSKQMRSFDHQHGHQR